MAESTIVHIGENSLEHVARQLLHEVMTAERKTTGKGGADGWTQADRKYLLDTYAECLRATRGLRVVKNE
jgi:hypothetical protein